MMKDNYWTGIMVTTQLFVNRTYENNDTSLMK